jgi:hypothetical protein
MAKARITESGNVKLTMSIEQFNVLNAIFAHVRLGSLTEARSDFSQLVIDIEKQLGTWEYNDEFDPVPVAISIVDDSDNVIATLKDNFCIELGDE